MSFGAVRSSSSRFGDLSCWALEARSLRNVGVGIFLMLISQ